MLLLISIGAQQLFSAQRWAGLKAQTLIAVDAAQNNLGANVQYAIRDLQKLPRELVVPELETRFEVETDPQRKLGLAFALARYEQVDAEFLVGQIDTVSQEDTSNFIAALDSDREQSITELRSEQDRPRSTMVCKFCRDDNATNDARVVSSGSRVQ